MNYLIEFAYPIAFLILLPILAIVAWWRYAKYKPIQYTYPLTYELKNHQQSSISYKTFFYFVRLAILLLLIFLIARPQQRDSKSQVTVEGVDMILVLDVSGSMQYADDDQDRRSRLEAAKDEAIKFIDRRDNDPIGLVLFAMNCVSRCPLTLDKNILKSIIKDLEIGVIDPNGTLLSTGIAMGVNRLKSSKAKSKVMIVLTDGAPTPGDIHPNEAIELATKFGIKIYTIGIGGDKPIMVQYGFQAVPIPPVNKELLQYIALKTGGKFFEAKKPQDMRTIYDTIDALEKTKIEADVFTNYHELFMPFLILALILSVIELVFSTFIWMIV